MKRILMFLSCLVALVVVGCGGTALDKTGAETKVTVDPTKFDVYDTEFGGILVDKETGCQYLSKGVRSAWTPRLTSKGQPMCNDNK
ncbi:hypothetical protein SP15_117 [Bacillus phage SP-15]|uniref:DUF6440 domain-containing protein n=1 Tax=Bacillus phage SP-15 TaxID=1792032 RepID=A0A127AWA2_9CAUD|nr:hypothetical protein SP15_117 [Bacillus phage SP-15]AMM44915.1 hypothetical protein SP15_117 [Bacillus phage SP-15]